jgi:hypothetical protein
MDLEADTDLLQDDEIHDIAVELKNNGIVFQNMVQLESS